MRTLLFITLIPLVSSLPSRVISQPTSASNADDFDYLEIPVFDENPQDIVYQFSCKKEKDPTLIRTKTFEVYLNKRGNAGDPVLVYSTTFIGLISTGTITVEHELPSFSEDVNVRFVVYSGSLVIYDDVFVTKYRHMGSPIDINKNDSYTTSGQYIVYTHKNGMSQTIESYEFSGFSSAYSPRYHIYDISSLAIKYTAPENINRKRRTLTFARCTLQFDDKDGVFQNFGNLSLPYTHSLPLKVTYKTADASYHFSIDQNMYVDPLTLRMSNAPLDGYVATKKLYIPREYDYLENTLTMMFSINDAGLNKEFIFAKTSILKDYSLLGMCGSGEYCVASTSGTPNFEIGESVTYQ